MSQAHFAQIIVALAVLYLLAPKWLPRLRRACGCKEQVPGGGCASGCGGCSLANIKHSPAKRHGH